MKQIACLLSLPHLTTLSIAFALLYVLAMYPPVRDCYRSLDKFAHALLFCGACLSLIWALPWHYWIVALLTANLGAAVEVHQIWLPGFSPSMKDWLADLAAIGSALFCILLMQSRNHLIRNSHEL